MRQDRLVAAASLATVLSATSLVHAAALSIRDGDRFALTLRDGIRTCLATLEHPLEGQACKNGNTPTLPAETADARTIAVGLLYLGDAPMLLTVALAKGQVPLHLDAKDATALVELTKPRGSSLRGQPAVKVLDVAGLPITRLVYDLDGMPPHNAWEHWVVFMVDSDLGYYGVVFSAPRAYAAEVEVVAEEAAATLTVAHPATSVSWPGHRLGYAFGGGIAGASLLALVRVLVARSHRRARAAGTSRPS